MYTHLLINDNELFSGDNRIIIFNKLHIVDDSSLVECANMKVTGDSVKVIIVVAVALARHWLLLVRAQTLVVWPAMRLYQLSFDYSAID